MGGLGAPGLRVMRSSTVSDIVMFRYVVRSDTEVLVSNCWLRERSKAGQGRMWLDRKIGNLVEKEVVGWEQRWL